MSSETANADFQIPRNSLAWLLVAQVVVILPHIPRLPGWVLLVFLICGFWRVMIYQGRWSYPSKTLKVVLVLAGSIGVIMGYGSFLGLDAGVAFLIVAYAFKLLEMHKQWDAYLVIFLSYFIIITVFLFSQTLGIGLYMIIAAAVSTAALIGMNQVREHHQPWKTFRLSCSLLLQSLPLMLIFFLMFPRVGPLWSVDLRNSSQTGMSDRMTPGDIADLSRSNKLAFRVDFANGNVPPTDMLYWRGLVFSDFDGRTWSTGLSEEERKYLTQWSSDQPKPWLSQLQIQGAGINYNIMIEPSGQPWLYSLTAPVSRDHQVGLTRDFVLVNRSPVYSRLSYDVLSYPQSLIDQELKAWMQRRETYLPKAVNPQARLWAAKQWIKTPSFESYVDAVLRHFHQKEFFYTLQPPKLGEHSIDEFLFKTRKGFCEHYAGAFVFLLRSVGIPARVVVGYQGGELNPVGKYLVVRQRDAHAWAEVWYKNKGWVRVDPTAAVAPERIQGGLEQALPSEDTEVLDQGLLVGGVGEVAWIRDLRQQLDAFNHQWNRWVLGYDAQLQFKFLENFFGSLSLLKLAFWLFILTLSLLLLLGVFLFWHQKAKPKKDYLATSYLELCDKLANANIPARAQGEAPMVYANRILLSQPDVGKALLQTTQAWMTLRYELLEPKNSPQQRKLLAIYQKKMQKTIKLLPKWQHRLAARMA